MSKTKNLKDKNYSMGGLPDYGEPNLQVVISLMKKRKEREKKLRDLKKTKRSSK